MKLKIEKEFKDKYNDKKYKIGDKVEFEEERAKELLSDPRELVSKTEEDLKEDPKEDDEKPKKPIEKSKK